jgi:hypothetical protein
MAQRHPRPTACINEHNRDTTQPPHPKRDPTNPKHEARIKGVDAVPKLASVCLTSVNGNLQSIAVQSHFILQTGSTGKLWILPRICCLPIIH